MNIKKILSIALVAVLSVGVLAGCGGGSSEESKETAGTETKKSRWVHPLLHTQKFWKRQNQFWRKRELTLRL